MLACSILASPRPGARSLRLGLTPSSNTRLTTRSAPRLRHPRVAEVTEASPAVADAADVPGEPGALQPDERATLASFCDKNIDWTSFWYPVATAKLIDPTRPNPVQLLGKNLVIWLDNEGQWRCFEDRCPHRAAPLSEGKVWAEKGTLMCSYHGFEFNGDGNCTRVPQSASAEAEARACTSKRSCVTTYPITEAQGLLYVWPQSGPAGVAAAEATPLPIDKILEASVRNGDDVTFIMPPYFRDLPYDYQTLVENVTDPAHVPFSHHGVQGNRDRVKYGDYEMILQPEAEKLRVSYDSGFTGKANISFEPPNIVNFYSLKPDPTTGKMVHFSFRIYCIPTAPGRSRIVSFSHTNNPKLPALFKLIRKLPVWVDHIIFRHPVLDGDNVFLHHQEHLLSEEARKIEKEEGMEPVAAGAASWKRNYFMPTRADVLLAAFRRWLDTAGRGGPYGPLHKATAYGPLVADHRVLLNRYEQHTKNCMACKKALGWVERLRAVTAAVAALGFGAALASLAQSTGAGLALKAALTTKTVAAGALTGLLMTLAWRWLSQTRDKFYFVNYDHATR